MKHNITVSVVMVLGCVLLVCPAAAMAAEPAISAGYIPGTTDIPVLGIKQLGLDKKYGLNLENKQFGDPDAINDAFMAGMFTTKWDDQVIGSLKEFMRIAVEEKALPRVVDELFSKDFAP